MKIYLAPMEGLADVYLRKLLTDAGGFDLVITEFVRVVDQGLPERTFLRQIPELQTNAKTDSGTPVRVQLLGNHQQALAENAYIACKLGSHGIDLNFGCPSKTVNKSRGGAVLLKEPETIYQAVKAVRSALPEEQTVSAKMRLGYEDTSLMWDCAYAIRDGGADELTVHARTKAQGYTPPAYWSSVANFEKNLGIPVIINGEIWTPEDADRAMTSSNTRSIMLGRGAVRNPLLAWQIKSDSKSSTDWQEVSPYVKHFWQMICAQMTPRYCSGRLKQWLNHLRESHKEADWIYQQIRTEKEVTKISELLNRI